VICLSGCVESGVGMPGGVAWNLTTSPDEKQKHYVDTCLSYGFQLGTPEMSQCRMQVANEIAETVKANKANLAQYNQQTRSSTITCNKFGSVLTCNQF
jgi:hypothetical protein